MIVKGIDMLKAEVKNKAMTGYVDGDSDLGIFEIRYDLKKDMFLIMNSSREWMVGCTDKDFFEGTNWQALAIGKGMREYKFNIIPRGTEVEAKN